MKLPSAILGTALLFAGMNRPPSKYAGGSRQALRPKPNGPQLTPHQPRKVMHDQHEDITLLPITSFEAIMPHEPDCPTLHGIMGVDCFRAKDIAEGMRRAALRCKQMSPVRPTLRMMMIALDAEGVCPYDLHELAYVFHVLGSAYREGS